jgi:hypothetical protein
MFKRLFGKKNDGFYMQVEDNTAEKAPQAKATPTTVVEKPVVAPIAEQPATEKSAVVLEMPVADGASATEVSKTPKTSIKDKKKDKKDKSEKAKTPEPVAATVATEPAITNFATDYLMKPSSNSNRRRPGANMKQFMDMARQVETKKSPGQRAKND